MTSEEYVIQYLPSALWLCLLRIIISNKTLIRVYTIRGMHTLTHFILLL